MLPIKGNMLGILMVCICALPAFVGGFLFKLPDPIVMGFVGITLIAMDMTLRITNRKQTGWLMKKELGGYLYFIPVWIFGIFVVILNIINAIRPLDL
jgi:hypothetical protein